MGITLERFVETRMAPGMLAHDKPSAILLTCIDYRYTHRIVDVMDRKGLRFRYDSFILAGASLGANPGTGTGKYVVPASWREAFLSHIRAARTIGHPIQKIYIFDHRGCGAYHHFLNLDWATSTPVDEAQVHQTQIQQLAQFLRSEFAGEIPNLEIEAILLARDEDDEIPT